MREKIGFHLNWMLDILRQIRNTNLVVVTNNTCLSR